MVFFTKKWKSEVKKFSCKKSWRTKELKSEVKEFSCGMFTWDFSKKTVGKFFCKKMFKSSEGWFRLFENVGISSVQWLRSPVWSVKLVGSRQKSRFYHFSWAP